TMLLRKSFFVLVAIFAFAGIATDVHANQRVALVIGNSAYQHTPRLENPKNDATDMAAVLKQLGFQVIDGFHLDKTAFGRKVREFSMARCGIAPGPCAGPRSGCCFMQVMAGRWGDRTIAFPSMPRRNLLLHSTGRWCAPTWCSAPWSEPPAPTSFSSMPAATIRSPAT